MIMGLLNYSTTIGVHKTLGEIQQILVDHGARKLMYDYDGNGHIESLSFSVITPNGEKGIRLPANVASIFEVLKQQKKAGKIKINADYDQAERVAWRIIKDWVEAQMAILESQMVQFEEVFFPYLLNGQGQTLFEAYKQKQIGA
jgi:hypothetical protein